MRNLLFIMVAMVALSANADNKPEEEKGQDNSQYYRLFTPLTFYHSVAQDQLSLGNLQRNPVADNVRAALLNIYLKRPDLVRFSEKEMQESGSLRDDLEAPIQQQATVVDEAAPLPEALPEVDPVDVVIEKPQFWKYKFDSYLQFMQNFVSDNWYKGGESNYAAVGSVTIEANYDNKSKWKWDNKLEMKLGLQTSPSDTVNKYKTNEDLIRYTGKIGLRAVNKWYYTLQVLAYTQFWHGLKANQEKVYSDFMSPFNLNVGIGMDYKVEAFNKRLTGAINMSPLALNYRYVDRANLAKSFGIKVDEGHTHSLVDFGSQLTASLEWKMNDVVSWKSRIYAYTSYHRVELEWENTFALRVSRYISANLFLFPRFDDSNNSDDKLGYWQFKEYSSLGFSYNF